MTVRLVEYGFGVPGCNCGTKGLEVCCDSGFVENDCLEMNVVGRVVMGLLRGLRRCGACWRRDLVVTVRREDDFGVVVVVDFLLCLSCFERCINGVGAVGVGYG